MLTSLGTSLRRVHQFEGGTQDLGNLGEDSRALIAKYWGRGSQYSPKSSLEESPQEPYKAPKVLEVLIRP